MPLHIPDDRVVLVAQGGSFGGDPLKLWQTSGCVLERSFELSPRRADEVRAARGRRSVPW